MSEYKRGYRTNESSSLAPFQVGASYQKSNKATQKELDYYANYLGENVLIMSPEDGGTDTAISITYDEFLTLAKDAEMDPELGTRRNQSVSVKSIESKLLKDARPVLTWRGLHAYVLGIPVKPHLRTGWVLETTQGIVQAKMDVSFEVFEALPSVVAAMADGWEPLTDFWKDNWDLFVNDEPMVYTSSQTEDAERQAAETLMEAAA